MVQTELTGYVIRCRDSTFFDSINYQCCQDNKHCNVGLLLRMTSALIFCTAHDLLLATWQVYCGQVVHAQMH